MEGSILALTRLGTEVMFYVLLLSFVIHAFFVGYHWFTYGANRRISLVALAVYLMGGAILLLTYSIIQSAV